MITAALLMMIPPPPLPFGPVRGNIDCFLEKGGASFPAMIELNQAGNGEVLLRGLGLAQSASVRSVDLEGGSLIGRNDRGEPQFQLTSAKPGKWGRWWRYAAPLTQGVCYGQLYGEQTDKAHSPVLRRSRSTR